MLGIEQDLQLESSFNLTEIIEGIDQLFEWQSNPEEHNADNGNVTPWALVGAILFGRVGMKSLILGR